MITVENMNYQEKYDEFKNIVEQNIFDSIPLDTNKSLYDAYQYIMSGGGKRIRPVLTMICAGAVGGNPIDAVNAASAIEILHNFTLVHDDIMDNSPIRRGRSTVHIKWNQDVAILSGDMMVGWAFRLLNKSKLGTVSQVAELNLTLANALIEVCEGQEVDMQFNKRNNVSITEYIEMIKLKTSSLLCCAAKLGAIAGNSSEHTIKMINEFAENLGIAFQIQDDILDFTADNIKFGKKIGQDIIEGKKTFPILKAAETAKETEDKILLNEYLNSTTEFSEEYVPQFINIFKKLGIFEISQNEIDKYFGIANDKLNNCENNLYVEMLKWLLGSINKRIY